ncbi:zinc finger protein [Ephemerocybe angulata]|uniref:Zinc finger protein n=1 Tax=Ephemerocybe angulata TaxID=980116 RepID=A0A8H6MAZ1_9AGAR|nr:zinc finger protein [Tulosesus angulatus]
MGPLQLQCCSDYHSYLSEGQSSVGPWRPSYSPAAPTHQHAMSAAPQSFWCDDCPEPTPSVAVPQQPTAFHQPHHQPQQLQQHTHQEPMIPSANHSVPLPVQDLPHKCMWHGCKQSFSLLSELVGHVNLTHLRPETQPPPPVSDNSRYEPQPQYHAQSQNAFGTGAPLDPRSPMSCLWDQCSLHLTPEEIAGPSTSSEYANFLTALESHLLQDHLGLRPGHFGGLVAPSTPQVSPAPSEQTPLTTTTATTAVAVGTTPSPPPALANTITSPASSSTGTGAPHRCDWQGCGSMFTSSDELTAHLTSAHVGGGKARYECFWDGCDRYGERGFSSKQKICRHLQSHTGHRPFQCQLCQQNFSEAATLQQHMRRHTQEKPYSCDFPGCGKSFAIMGALTIHKRIHNGLKPFKCSYCGRAFTESSNLSKHLRTHTGARPYTCTEPSCGKSFARPDQLTRHMGIHRKNVVVSANAPLS